METINQLPVIDIQNLTKASSEDLAENIIGALLSGDINPLEFAVKKKLLSDALDMVLKNESVKDLCISEVQKFGKTGATALGASITLKELPKYDYSKDPIWAGLNTQAAPLLEALKAQEEKIKMASKMGCSLVDESTGEIIATVVPAPSTTSIAVSFPKVKK